MTRVSSQALVGRSAPGRDTPLGGSARWIGATSPSPCPESIRTADQSGALSMPCRNLLQSYDDGHHRAIHTAQNFLPPSPFPLAGNSYRPLTERAMSFATRDDISTVQGPAYSRVARGRSLRLPLTLGKLRQFYPAS